MSSKNPPASLGYADVKCKECGKEYVCTPEQDYYNATTPNDGVCWDCLLKETKTKPIPEPEAPVVGADGLIGIRLVGGPPPLDGWTNAYAAHELWGWPPPDQIAAFNIGGKVAVALPENVPQEMHGDMTVYNKVKESKLPEPDEDAHWIRGAVYEAVTNGE